QLEHALVVVAVIADLVPAALGDRGARVGMLVGDLPGHHERRRQVVPVEQRMDARQRRTYVVVAAGERTQRLELERPAPQRLGVEVDGQRRGAAIAVLPHARRTILEESCGYAASSCANARLKTSSG